MGKNRILYLTDSCLTPQVNIPNAGILCENSKIIGIGGVSAFSQDEPNLTVVDMTDCYAMPGLIDSHVHGGGGFNTYKNPVEAAEFFLKHGETTILATPAYMMNFEEFLYGIRTVKENLPKTRNIRGFYMEGPYTNGNYGCNKHLYS